MRELQFSFNSTEWRLLRNVLNEVLNGFVLENFDVIIGKGKTELQNLIAYLHSLPEGATVDLDFSQATAFRNALQETLRELGSQEFHTRTGYSFADGENVLRKLNTLINAT